MTTTTPTYPLGTRVVALGQPGSAMASVREGGPGRVISDDERRGDSPFVWVRLDQDGREFPYLPCELKPEPSV